VQAKAEKKGEKEEEEDEVGSVTSEEFNTFLDAMGGRAKERTTASAIIGSYLHGGIVFFLINFLPSHFFFMVG
jgi:hypothetical protein